MAEFVPDESAQRAWRDFLHHRRGEPSDPPPIRPLIFKGRSSADAVVEIRRDRSGELGVEVDCRLVERLSAEQAPLAVGAAAVFRLDGVDFRESFDAQPGAVRALRDFCASPSNPAWGHASELLADGLIDVTFGLTAPGRRALDARGERQSEIVVEHDSLW